MAHKTVPVSFFQHRHAVQPSLFSFSEWSFLWVPLRGLHGCCGGCKACKGPAAIRLLGATYSAAANAGPNRLVSLACIAYYDRLAQTARRLFILITASSSQAWLRSLEHGPVKTKKCRRHAECPSCRCTARDHQQDQRYLHWSGLVFAAVHHCVSQQCQCESHGLPLQGNS